MQNTCTCSHTLGRTQQHLSRMTRYSLCDARKNARTILLLPPGLQQQSFCIPQSPVRPTGALTAPVQRPCSGATDSGSQHLVKNIMTGGEAAGRQGKGAAAKEAAAAKDATYEAVLASALAKVQKQAEEEAKECGCAVEDIFPAVDDHEMQTLEELEDLLGVEGVDAVVDEMFDEAEAAMQGLTEAEGKALLKHRLLSQGQ